MEENLEREKKIRGDLEKTKRKLETDLKSSQENFNDIEKSKQELEDNIRKKDIELSKLNVRLEDESGLVAQLQRKIKDLQVMYF